MKKFFILFSPEIIIKSHKVCLFFKKTLFKNIKNKIKSFSNNLIINYYWDRLEIINKSIKLDKFIINNLKYIPGINKILIVDEFIFTTFKDIWNKIQFLLDINNIKKKTFAIKVKKTSNYSFTTKNLEFYLGHKIKEIIDTDVKLTNPDFLIEIRFLSNNKWIFIKKTIMGINGFPISSNNSVLSLISGGFDSALSSFLMLKKGCPVHFCYFNFFPFSNELHIINLIKILCKNTGLNYIHIIVVPFEKLSNFILNTITPNYIPIILKILIIKITTNIANIFNIKTLITGESLGQVSSQTLTNLQIIDKSTNLTILRPLITYNKQEIIDNLKTLKLYNICNGIPEYCGLFGKKATAKASFNKVEKEEKKIPISLLKEAVDKNKTFFINLYNETNNYTKKTNNSNYTPEFININQVTKDFLILDIRPKKQQLLKPFVYNNKKFQICSIPYLEFKSLINTLDKNLTWLLYCENNNISYLQAIDLYNQGYKNIKILSFNLK